MSTNEANARTQLDLLEQRLRLVLAEMASSVAPPAPWVGIAKVKGWIELLKGGSR